MTTTAREDERFAQEVIGNYYDFLDKAINWIRFNLKPETVFTEEQLSEWAKNNYEFED